MERLSYKFLKILKTHFLKSKQSFYIWNQIPKKVGNKNKMKLKFLHNPFREFERVILKHKKVCKRIVGKK